MSTPRMLSCLQSFEAGAHVTVDLLAKVTGWSGAIASRTLTNAKQLGYVDVVFKAPNGINSYTLSAKGRASLEKLKGNKAQFSPSNDLAARALKLINDSPAGLNSEELGDKLDEHAADVEEALALHVARHALVHCAVTNPRGSFVHYRASSGTASSAAWVPPGGTQFNNNPLPEQRPAKAPAGANPADVPPPAPKAEPRKGVPFVGTLDIDAIYRTPGILRPGKTSLTPAELQEHLDAQAMPPMPPLPQGEPAHEDPDASVDQDQGFLCCLYSDGTLWMQDAGRQFSLNVAETKKLLHYLDHLRADLIVEEALAADGDAS